MAAKKKQLYSQSTLEQLSKEPNSCVSLVESERKLDLHPIYLNDIKSGVWDLLNKNLKRFDRSLNGILMGYKNVKIVVDNDTGRIKGRCGEFEVLVKLKFYIFQPRVGSYLEGVVNKKSQNHIGCLVHRYFNAVILKPELIEYEDWICKNFDINDKIVFKVNELDFSGMLPRIEGVVENDCVPKKDSQDKKKKRLRDEKGNESQSDEALDESFLKIEMTNKDTQEEKKDKTSKDEKKHMKKKLELICNSTQRLSATEKEIQDADFSFLSPVAPPVPIKKKKKEKHRDSDDLDNVITSTQIPTTNKDDTSDFSTLSPIERVDEELKIRKKKKKKDKDKDKDKKNGDEVDKPITSTQIPSDKNEKLEADDFYIFTPPAKNDESLKVKDQKTKKKDKTKKKLDKDSITTTNAQIPVQNQDLEPNDAPTFNSIQKIDNLSKDKKPKKKKKDKDKDRDRSVDKSDECKSISKSKNKPTENKKLETVLDKKDVEEESLDPMVALELVMNKFKKPSKHKESGKRLEPSKQKESEKSLDPLEALELVMKTYKKPLEADDSDSDDDTFIPGTQIPPNVKSSNLPEILSRTSFNKTTDSDTSQKSLKTETGLKNKFNTVNLKSPVKLMSPKKRGLSDSDSGSSSLAKKPKFDAKDTFKHKLELVNHKSSKKKIEPEKVDSPKKLFSPEKSLFSDSDASVKNSPKKLPKTQNLLIDDLLKEQTLTMLGRGDTRDDEKKDESPVPVKKTKKEEALIASKNKSKKEKTKDKKSKSESKVEIPKTSKLMHDILEEAKKSLISESEHKKEKSKSSKKSVVNGAIDKILPDLVRESTESMSMKGLSKEKKSSKKEKEAIKVDEVSSANMNFNSGTKFTGIESTSREESVKEKKKKNSKKEKEVKKLDKTYPVSSTEKLTDLELKLKETSVKEKNKKNSKKEKDVKKSNKTGTADSTKNSKTESVNLEIEELLSMALANIGYEASSSKNKKKNISI